MVSKPTLQILVPHALLPLAVAQDLMPMLHHAQSPQVPAHQPQPSQDALQHTDSTLLLAPYAPPALLQVLPVALSALQLYKLLSPAFQTFTILAQLPLQFAQHAAQVAQLVPQQDALYALLDITFPVPLAQLA